MTNAGRVTIRFSTAVREAVYGVCGSALPGPSYRSLRCNRTEGSGPGTSKVSFLCMSFAGNHQRSCSECHAFPQVGSQNRVLHIPRWLSSPKLMLVFLWLMGNVRGVVRWHRPPEPCEDYGTGTRREDGKSTATVPQPVHMCPCALFTFAANDSHDEPTSITRWITQLNKHSQL